MNLSENGESYRCLITQISSTKPDEDLQHKGEPWDMMKQYELEVA